MSYKSAETVVSDEGRQYHTGVCASDLAPYILLCGDPARAYRVAEHMTDTREPICNREYVTITGVYQGTPVTIMATGMGPDNTEMAVVEVGQLLESPTYIRIGTSGGLGAEVDMGDQVIASAAHRGENTSLGFVTEGFPAVANYEVTSALLESAHSLGHRYHLGITATASGFYGAQGRRVPKFSPRNSKVTEDLANMGILNFEMEASCLFTLSSISGARAGCVCYAVNSRSKNTWLSKEQMSQCELNTIMIGLEAAKRLSTMDKLRGENAQWLPSMGLNEE